MPSEESIRIPATTLTAFIATAFTKSGLPREDAHAVADLMVEIDLTGGDAHGIFRLPQYIGRLRTGAVNAHPNITVERSAPATAVIDGDNGMGHLVMARATETAISLARENGIGWVGARRSNHAGTAGIYAAMPIAHGMVGIYAAVANANHMAVWGGTDLLLGTNPLGVCIPAGEEPPIVLDLATTVVSYGTVKNYALQDRAMPEGWMVDAKGAPMTDPKQSAHGMLLPIGGYKGSGLALVLGLLAGTLNGAAFGRDVIDFNADEESATNTGHFILALDIARFAPLDTFKADVDRHVRDLRASALMPGVDAIRLPGDRRAQCRANRVEHGVPIPPRLLARLDALAGEIGVGRLVG